VIDGGVGIPTDVIDRIFDPFFTTKPQREGTGLGLSQVDGIVADFGGAIEVSSVIDTGTAFRIWLPVSSDAASEPPPNSESKK
jgi:signal transduction histidine kinase